MSFITKGIFCLTSLLVIASGSARASIYIPADLNPGDSYRLIYVTDGTRNATSSDIATYNSFVAAEATAITALNDLDTTWTAVASTTAVDARDNTGTNPNIATGVPIYLLNGSRIAANNADFWDESIESTISISPTLQVVGSTVWTGTHGDGTEFTYYDGPLGNSTKAIAGRTNVTNTNWVRGPQENLTTSLPLYGISGELTVPVPEPASCAHVRNLHKYKRCHASSLDSQCSESRLGSALSST